MQIVLPSNVTTLTLASVDTDWAFSVAGNTAEGSTGLTDWLCKYDYYATPSTPQLVNVVSHSADSVIVTWTPLQCDANNKARVLRYIIQCVSNLTGRRLSTLCLRKNASTSKRYSSKL